MLKKIAGTLLTIGFAGLTWAQPIDLNKASEIELDALKGVGPALTQELMNERKKAHFKDWEDATSRVKGLGPQKASSLSDQGVRGCKAVLTQAKPPRKPTKSDKDSAKATAKSADAAAGKAPPAKN